MKARGIARKLASLPSLGALCLAVASIALIAGPAGAAAASGSLDRSFGTRGHAIAGVNLIEPELWYGLETEVARSPDGRVFVAASAFPAGRNAIVAFGPDGEIDRSFGANGRLRIAELEGRAFEIGAIATDAAGRLLVAGQPAIGLRANRPLTVMRFTPDGRPDPSLGGYGVALRDVEIRPFPGALYPAGALATGIAVDGLGRIVVGAQAITGGGLCGGFSSAYIARFNADGSVDSSFGDAGAVIFEPSQIQAPYGLTLLGGAAPMFHGQGEPCKGPPGGPWLNRLTAAGTPDSGFGVAGGVVTGPLRAIGADAQGRVLMLNDKGALTRLTASGRVDQGFERSGTKAMPDSWQPGGIAVTAGGQVLVSGTELYGDEEPPRRWLVLTRVDAGGEVVRGFGRRGVVRTSLGPGSGSSGEHVLLDGRGGAIVVGPVSSPRNPRIPVGFGLFRYHLQR